jgi:protein-disulfide isomerase
MAAYDTCMASPTYAGLVRKETGDGTNKGINQTPTLFINGTYYTGSMSVSGIGDAIVAAAGGASPAPVSGSAAPTSLP